MCLLGYLSANLEEKLRHTDLVLSAVVPELALLTRPVGSVVKHKRERLSTKLILILCLNLAVS